MMGVVLLLPPLTVNVCSVQLPHSFVPRTFLCLRVHTSLVRFFSFFLLISPVFLPSYTPVINAPRTQPNGERKKVACSNDALMTRPRSRAALRQSQAQDSSTSFHATSKRQHCVCACVLYYLGIFLSFPFLLGDVLFFFTTSVVSSSSSVAITPLTALNTFTNANQSKRYKKEKLLSGSITSTPFYPPRLQLKKNTTILWHFTTGGVLDI